MHRLQRSHLVHEASPHNQSDIGQSRMFLLKMRYLWELPDLLKCRLLATTISSVGWQATCQHTGPCWHHWHDHSPQNNHYHSQVWLITRLFTHWNNRDQPWYHPATRLPCHQHRHLSKHDSLQWPTIHLWHCHNWLCKEVTPILQTSNSDCASKRL